ncbi:MAG: acyltransferase [Chitinivibrionales bacterium]
MKDNLHRPRILWADFLKIFAMYAVVIIHSAAPLLVEFGERGERVWWIGNLYDSAARWCIPVFFMLSGAFLIGKAQRMGPVPFLGRRLQRIGIPFLIWSALYFIWNVEINQKDLAYRYFFLSIVQEPAYYHLWYLYVLIGVYLFAPLLSVFLDSASRTNLIHFVILWIVFGSLAPTLGAYFETSLFMMSTAPFSLFRFLGYFLIGYLLKDFRCGVWKCIGFGGLFLLGLAVTAAGTWWLTVARGEGEFSGVFYEYWSPNVLAMAVSLFVIVKNLRLPSGVMVPSPIASILTFTAACVPGIYLVHALIIAFLQQEYGGFGVNQYIYDAVVGVPLFALVVFVISLIVVAVIRFIPLLRRIVP